MWMVARRFCANYSARAVQWKRRDPSAPFPLPLMSDPKITSSSLPVRVLFVCLGNICRSPMAEAVFRHKVALAGLSDKIVADGAGTGNWHEGNPPDPRTRAELDKHGVSYDGMVARQIDRADLDTFDYILTMDDENLANVQALGDARRTLRPLMDYAPETGASFVPDPYYKGGFDVVYDLVNVACNGLLAAIRKERNL